MSIQDDANYQRLTAALITAVEAWPTVRRTGGATYADGAVDAARAALTTYSQVYERMQPKPAPQPERIVVRIPRGAPRVRASRAFSDRRPRHPSGQLAFSREMRVFSSDE